MVFLFNCTYLFSSTFWLEEINDFPPVVLVEIDENGLLILSRNGMDLVTVNTLEEPDRMPWRMHGCFHNGLYILWKWWAIFFHRCLLCMAWCIVFQQFSASGSMLLSAFVPFLNVWLSVFIHFCPVVLALGQCRYSLSFRSSTSGLMQLFTFVLFF